ncbi:Transcriptional regulator, MarR family [Serinicoccus hydrothermalis]|uniref:Transcriptional regulator, MarR family n=1 Tax=Serinicoccus hydrothermalis TaxID=1758689 RepID=A0A1B1NE64_9MICO|nr:MarR family transcriptional regulator [Serinicoccus hydrothermalis]ANS79706.1 Transcriptional regulator, MarR family [Serinicoccus hydrothermalis]
MAPDPNPSLEQAHALTGKLFRVVELARSDFAAVAAELDLTPLQARTLLWLEHPSAMRDLAGHLACDASNVTGLADRLERRGVVERVAGEDRRVKLLQLTDEGRRLRGRLARRVAAGSTVSARLTASERAQLGGLLDRMLETGRSPDHHGTGSSS